MVKLNKIYTRTGDDGTTGLVDGSRRMKSDALIAAIGAVDETNAVIGLARLHVSNNKGDDMDAMLGRIQNDLFDLGADIATPLDTTESAAHILRISAGQVDWLEAQIDALNAGLEPLASFILPAGTPLATHLHLSRCVARRAERHLVAVLTHGERVSQAARHYLNRLSDLLFVASRIANREGEDVLWKPRANQ